MAPDSSSPSKQTRQGLADATRSAVERYIDRLNAHDPDGIAACVTDDFLNEHTSRRGRSVQGRKAYRERLTSFLEEFEDLSYEIEDMVVDADRAAVAYRLRCNWWGAATPGPADGRTAGLPVELRGTFWFRVERNLVAHRRDYWDGEDFARQAAPG